MADDWRKASSFSERLAATAQMHAEYHELCSKAIQFLLSSDEAGPTKDHHADEHIFPNLPTTGAHIGRYVNAQHYKDGVFSEVFKAVDPDCQRNDATQALVALKITTPSMMTTPHDSRREARILAEAKSDNIIRLLQTFEQAGGHLVLVFPFKPYGLDDLLRQRQLTKDSRRFVLHDIFSGLAHLHNLGIIHRDVKPSNVLLDSAKGPAYLTDLGISWSPTDSASEPAEDKNLDVGTTCYRPPELLFGHQAYGVELDMWAAGCVAAQVVCLNGTSLFDAGDLGSELALIKSIFETLGTPDLDIWPEAERFPDWGKMNFTKYPAKAWEQILPSAEAEAIDLVSRLVVFESNKRLSAKEAIDHQFVKKAMKG